jgi:hypothetical protein
LNSTRFGDFLLVPVQLGCDFLIDLLLAHVAPRQFLAFATQDHLFLQTLQKLSVGPGFFHKIGDAVLHCFHSDPHRGPTGHHNNGRRTFQCGELRQQVEPFATRGGVPRVVQIHQNEVELLARDRFEQLRGRRNGFGRIAVGLQQEMQSADDVGLIVRDQNSDLHCFKVSKNLGCR